MKSVLVILAVVVVATVGLGFYLGWFSVAADKGPSGEQVNLTLKVDKEKIREDAAQAKARAAELGDKAKKGASEALDKAKQAVAGNETAEGKLVAMEENRLTLAAAKEMLVIETSPDTKLQRGGEKIELSQLKEGERLRVVYKTEERRNVAQSITVVEN